MKLKTSLILSGIVLSQPTFAINNSSYNEITRMYSWKTENSIYLEEEHTCPGTDKNLYKLPKTDDQQYSLLLAAFSAGFTVRLSYLCASNDYPEITGVRVQK